MNKNDEERLKELVRQAVPPVKGEAEAEHDLWPAVLRQIDSKSARVPWFDWALAGGLAAMAVFFPAAVPILLYYL
jgi:hypothetical protein